MATTVQYKGQVLVTVDNQTKVLETSGKWCEDDFTLVDVSGGGSMGGLSQMVDVNSSDYNFAYMLMKMKKGETVGGTVTYSEAFTNTEQTILQTGLTTLHGIMFIAPSLGYLSVPLNQTCKFVFITINEDTTFNVYGQSNATSGNMRVVVGMAQGTSDQSGPINGTLRFSGGDVLYSARYNKNANYQLLRVGVEYEWLAW